jgi:hypothetical protein
MPLSKTGPPREGFEYQDLQGVLALLDWLGHPANFAWIKFEAKEYGSLDDFAVCDSNRNLRLNQVKHTGETPGRADFTFDDLTDSPAPGRRSLFEKWYNSWTTAKRRGVFASITPVLKTNKSASRNMLALTKAAGSGRVLDSELLKTEHGELYGRLSDLASKSDGAELDEFLRVLQFEFGLPDISVLRNIAQEKCLGLSLGPDVCRNLEDEVWNWAKRGSELSLPDVKRACSWFEPRGLDQHFPIPADYVRLGGNWIDKFSKLLSDVESGTGGTKVIVGTPGSGKSTFLEDLYETLVEQDIACIRHHYYVPGMEKYDRLRFEDAASALIHELQLLTENVVPSINPRPEELDKIIAAAAASLHQSERPLVVILDGLDHVVRDEDESELIELLRKILPPRPGFWLVLGTRDFARDSRVATILEEYVPRHNWIPMPRLDPDECARLLDFHRAELKLEHDNHFDDIASTFSAVTAGYPLYARYVIRRMTQLATHQVLLASDLRNIEPFGGDVPMLYAQIWRSLPAAARTIAVLLAVAQFEIDHEELSLALSSINTIEVLNGLETLKPLLTTGITGFQFFHTSFAEYVRTTEDFLAIGPRLRSDLIRWLEDSAPEEKRWTWLLRKKAEYGNPEPLISETTRSWIIESLREGRQFDEVVHTLQLASTSAMVRNDYATAFARGQHSIYMQNSLQFYEQEWNKLDIINRRRIDSSVLTKSTSGELAYREPTFLLELARDADAVGDRELVEDIVEELNHRLSSGRRSSSSYPDSAEKLVECLLRVAALLRDSVTRATRFIDKGLNADYQPGAAAAFADELIRSGQQIAFLEFIKSKDLAARILVQAADAGALAALHSNVTINSQIALDAVWWRVYQTLLTSAAPSTLQLRLEIPETLADYDSKGQAQLVDLYQQVFGRSLLCRLENKQSEVETWISKLPGSWGHKAAGLIAEYALQCGTALRSKHELQQGTLSKFNSLDRLNFGKDRDIWGFQTSLRKALISIFRTSFVLLHNIVGMKIRTKLLNELADSKFLEDQAVRELMADLPPRALDADDVQVWISKQAHKWDTIVDELPTRAEAYLSLAALSLGIRDVESCSVLVRKSIDNLLGYGNHKDLFLLEVIESVDSFRDSPAALDWFTRIAPISNSVADFTDRDETSELAVDFGAALAKYDRFVAFRQYVDLVTEESLYLAENLFAKLIPQLDFNDDFEYAIARTCIDYDSRSFLRKRLDSAADKLVKELDSLYGPESQPERHESGLPGETEAEPEVEKVNPDGLKDAISNMGYSRKQAEFLAKWLEFWIPRAPQEAYAALKPWLDPERRASFEGAIALKAYPYVRQFEGPNAGFALLCSAHRSSYGWSRFFADSSTAKEIFSILEQDFPQRWREFIHETLKHRRPENYGILTVPVGVRFLLRFRAKEEAGRLCEAAVKTLEELMDELPLPGVQWTEQPANALDVLFARLFWISAVVRERTAFVLSELLLTSSSAGELFEFFVVRLANERLDSRAVVLLMPIVRAVKHGFRADFKKLITPVQVSSTPVKELLRMIEATG